MSLAKTPTSKSNACEPVGEAQNEGNHTAGGEANGSAEPHSSPAKESTQLLASQAPDPDREARTLNFVIKAPPKASFIKMIHKAECMSARVCGHVFALIFKTSCMQ